ncbi:pyrroline-5-carboxylate reductase [Peribacillus sp. SCS-155]|uniref:pyrroline-5-carboxylate reductase n=1 Tax=Peribacillus sedimenti TaxID=3115297 RepID=UPI003905D131
MKKIAFIGAGSMAEAIISGLITGGVVTPSQIYVRNRNNQDRLAKLKRQYKINICTALDELLEGADVVLLAVKPKDVLAAMNTIHPYIQEHMLFISVAAGVSTKSLEEVLQKEMAIVRAMPNTSAAVGKSATAIAANKYTDQSQLELAKRLFDTIGLATVVDEHHLDGVTGLSGSGPAYIYYLVEAMEKSSESLGLDKATSKQLIIQTLIGAAEMLNRTEKTPATLRKEVTSPGGTTEAGIKVLEAHGVKEALISCIQEAALQSQRMGMQISSEMLQPKAIKKNA